MYGCYQLFGLGGVVEDYPILDVAEDAHNVVWFQTHRCCFRSDP